MSEYWKSTPKYWCKFCKAYVKDTKFEKEQHELTGKHRGAVQRSLRGIHKEHEQEEREKERAKAEVARVSGIVSGKPATASDSSAAYKKLAQNAPAPKVTAEERKRQMKQLADMGVAVPEQYRGDMAMAGDWQTVSVTRIDPDEDSKGDSKIFGVRKRKLEGEEEEELMDTKRRGWGSTIRTHPIDAQGSEDIEALLKESKKPEVETPPVKQEEKDEVGDSGSATLPINVAEDVKKDELPATAPVVFKKRKLKTAKS